jgi:phospholipid N-methyltransferase
MGRLGDIALFFREFLGRTRTTGAIVPSGRFLAAALTRFIVQTAPPRRILEVGPGTGAVTSHIVAALGPDDRLDLVEVNQRFVARLRQRFATEPRFIQAASRVRFFCCTVEEMPTEDAYDLIISGLPLNNFSVETVERILAAFHCLLRPGGTLSFFQYIALRRLKALCSDRKERVRLRGVGCAIHRLLEGHEIRRDWVWLNIPPAWAHHVRWGAPAGHGE